MYKRLLLSLLCCLSLSAFSQSIERYEFWFDHDYEARFISKAAAGDVSFEADASKLMPGVHTMTLRAQDSNGSWSVLHSYCFIRTTAFSNPVLTKYEYWIDSDFSKRTTVSSSAEIVSLDVDASKFLPGVHTLTFRAQDSNGSWSVPHSYCFIRTTASSNPVLTKYEYWIDFDFSKRTVVSSSAEIVSLDVDASKFLPGIHTLTFRAQDSNGSWSVPHTYVFIRQSKFSGENNRILGYKYWFNDDTANAKYVNVEPTDSLELSEMIPVTGVDLKVTPENICMIADDNGKTRLGVRNTLNTMFKDANKLWSAVKVDTFTTVIDAQNIDLTAFMVNPDASLGNKGWTVLGAMSVQKENDNPYFCLGNTSNNGWTAQMKQTVNGLPAGTYILTANGRASENAKLVLSVGDIDADFDSLGDNWGTSSLSFTTDGQPFDIVIKGEATGKNQWVNIDGLRLTMGSQSSLTVKMPELANMNEFRNQKLVVASSQNAQTLTTTQAKEYVFRGLSANGVYRISMQTMYDEEIAVLDNVTIDEGENVVTLPELKPVCNVRLSVTDGDGAILTSKVAINWQDGNGKYLANGSEIGGMVEGSRLAYTVTLSDSLGTVYAEPDRTEYTVKNDGNNIQVVLQRLAPVTLQGTVRNSIMSMSGAQVSAVQWINGRYVKTVGTQTGSKGEFSLPVYNDSTKLTISSDGYLDKVITLASVDGDTDLGNILLQEIIGTTLHLDMSYQKSVSEDETAEVQSWYTDINNVEFAIRNVTADSLVTGFNVQNYSIVTYSPLNVGDRLEITVKSRNNDFADVIVNTDVSDSTVVVIPLVEKGGISASYISSANSECIGILYDANGVQKARTAYTAGSLSFRQLEDGAYTLVSMGNSRLLGNVMNLSDLSSIGLNEGEHYIINKVSVENGVIRNVEVEEIPEIDEMLFYYTGTGTSFAANKSSVTVGQYVTLTTKIDFKEDYRDDVRNISLVFDLPEGCEYVPNSAIVGTLPADCSIDGKKITIALDDECYSDRIRFCITPTVSGNYVPSAFVQFSNGGDDVMQPLGNVAFTAEAMSINVPSITSKKQITASGITVPYSTVSLMDNGALMGTATSKADGSWMMNCNLYNAYHLTKHDVFAKVLTPTGVTLQTGNNIVEVDLAYNEVKSVTMINTAHNSASLNTCDYVTVFDYENPAKESPVYWYWPLYPEFTFVVDFTNKNAKNSREVIVNVETSSGDVRRLPATYNSNQQKWVATGKFTSESLPVNVDVSHESKVGQTIDMARSALRGVETSIPNTSNIVVNGVKDVVLEGAKQYVMDMTIGDKPVKTTTTIGGTNVVPEGFEMIPVTEDACMFTRVDPETGEITYLIPKFLLDLLNTPLPEEPEPESIDEILKEVGDHAYGEIKEKLESLDSPIPSLLNVGENVWGLAKDAIAKYNELCRMWDEIELLKRKCDLIDIAHCNSLQRRLENLFKNNFTIKTVASGIATIETYIKNKAISSALKAGTITLQFAGNIGYDSEKKLIQYEIDTYGYNCFPKDMWNTIKESKLSLKPTRRTPNAKYVLDPSGYVYEAVSSNRIEGVTATVFQKTEVEDMYGDKHDVITKWDAEPYSQKNPVLTDANGLYAWDVPEGWWQVKFEKEGYETVTTDWLPVPPPQLDINIPMYHGVAPEVEKARGFESGVTLTFSKYMRPESFGDGTVTVTRNGMAEKGSLTTVDAEKEPTGDNVFARKVKFVPEMSFNTTDNVVVTVKKDVESYCGMPMAKDVSMVVPIEPEIRAIESDSVVTVPYQGNATITVTVVPADAAVGKTLKAETSSPMILSLGGLTQGQPLQEAIVDKDGKATFTVNGELPGAAQLTFTMAETDVVGQSKVEVVIPVTQVAAPTASIKSGSKVSKGTLVALASDTEGAVIYYTLDGSCPCDENARKLYTEPIAINEDTEINAIAVKDGMDDSEISTFRYTIDDSEGIESVGVEDGIGLKYENGKVVVTNATGSHCRIYDVAGKLLKDTIIKYSVQQITVKGHDTLIVHIVAPDGKSLSNTINTTK